MEITLETATVDRAPYSGPIVEGIDVSSAQGRSVDWGAVQASGVVYAWAKCTDGATGIDSTYSRHRAAAMQTSILFGAYHFARPHVGPFLPQAENLLRVVGDTSYFVMLDLETGLGKISDREYADWVRGWVQHVASRIGPVSLYAGAEYMVRLWPLLKDLSLPIHIPAYGTMRPGGSIWSQLGADWTWHQYVGSVHWTDDGQVPPKQGQGLWALPRDRSRVRVTTKGGRCPGVGVECDRNAFRGVPADVLNHYRDLANRWKP